MHYEIQIHYASRSKFFLNGFLICKGSIYLVHAYANYVFLTLSSIKTILLTREIGNYLPITGKRLIHI